MFKKLYNIGIATYCLLFILSVFFYKERTVFLDIAYHLFYMVKDGGFAIQNYRFGAVFTQLFPLSALKLGMPLKGIMFSYSTGFIVYYFVCYLVCGLLLKNYRVAIVLLLFSTLFITDTFFWMQSELPQGIAFMGVFLAFITSPVAANRLNLPVILAVLAFACVTAFFHPLLMFCFLYAVFFIAATSDAGHKPKVLWVSAGLYVLMLIVKNVFFKTPYDSGAMEDANRMIEYFPNYFTKEIHGEFVKACLRKYFWIPVSCISITALYVYIRQWGKLALFGFFVVGYTELVNLSYMYDHAPAFYMENLYLPLAVFIALPVAYDLLPVLGSRKIAIPFIALVSITCLLRIGYIGRFYQKRLNWEREYLSENIDKKLVVPSHLVPYTLLLQHWGSSYEFWLLSTTEFGKTASIIISDHADEKSYPPFTRTEFITNWEWIPYRQLKPPYFLLIDTVSSYTIVK